MSASPQEVPVAEQIKLAAEGYIYGYPLVRSLDEVASFVAGGGSLGIRAPYNEFGHARSLAGPEVKFVSPNNDTCYSIAMCDLRQGPLVLHVPEMGDRYYVLQFIDAWSNNFAYIGRRATGTREADFLLAPGDYVGDIPPGMRVVRAPTEIVVIGGRIQVDGESDLPVVRALQDQFRLTPLSEAQGAPEGGSGVGSARGW